MQISEKESVSGTDLRAIFNNPDFLIFGPVKWTRIIQEKQVQALLKQHAKEDVAQLALKWSGKKDLPVTFLLTQLQCRQKAISKLPSWQQQELIVYPDSMALEQCSSEKAALFKAKFVASIAQEFIPTGKLLPPHSEEKKIKIIDLTGGLGVDSWALSKVAEHVVYVEPDASRFELAQHNFGILGCNNISFINKTAEEVIADNDIDSARFIARPRDHSTNSDQRTQLNEHNSTNYHFDLIYIDPSRRDAQQKRFFKLKDLQPDVLQLMPALKQIGKKILLKAAPMLDIKQALLDMDGAEKIIVLSLHNECREILFLLGTHNTADPSIECVELDEPQKIFCFRFREEENLEIKTGPIAIYIYDPHAAITKAGAFKSITSTFHLAALHANTHVYTGDKLITDFPGKVYAVKTILPYDPKNIMKLFPEKRATIVLRNFPVESAKVLKQLPLKSDSKNYVFLVTDNNGKAVAVVCEKVIC